MYRSRVIRDLLRMHAQELARRDEMIQSLLDRIQHPDRTMLWREPIPPLDEPVQVPREEWIFDADQLPT